MGVAATIDLNSSVPVSRVTGRLECLNDYCRDVDIIRLPFHTRRCRSSVKLLYRYTRWKRHCTYAYLYLRQNFAI